MASVAQAIPYSGRPGYGRCVIACATAWFSGLFALTCALVAARALSERWFGDVDSTSGLGFFSSSLPHPLGTYGLVTAALVIGSLLRVWMGLQCSTRVAWWAAVTVGALGAAGTHVHRGGGVTLLLIAAGVTAIGIRARTRDLHLPRRLVGVALVAWLLVGVVLFVAAGRAVVDAPLKIVSDGTGTHEMVGLRGADATPPFRLTVRNRSASPLPVRSVDVEIRGAGARQSLMAGLLPSGGFSFPAPITHSFVIAPHTDVEIGATWRSVCAAGPPGHRRFTATVHVRLAERDWIEARSITYECMG